MDIADDKSLRDVYLQPGPGAVNKQLARLDEHCRRFIELSPFLCIGTAAPGGLADVSPRGGEPGFVHVLDETTLALPDRPGNNRLDTMTNILAAPGVGLLFFIPGIEDTLRVNGLGRISKAPDLMQRFVERGKEPRSVLTVEVKEAYLHCTKALRRAALWDPETFQPRTALPSAGQIYRDHCAVDIAADLIDRDLEADAKHNLY